MVTHDARRSTETVPLGRLQVLNPNPVRQIPQDLRTLNRWLRWRLVRDERSGRKTKVPDCSTRDASALRPFERVIGDTIDAEQGVGFCFTGGVDLPSGRVFALDLDACRDPLTGAVEPWAMEIVQHYGYGFVEITPSGTGLRVWFIARKFPRTFTKAKVKAPSASAPNCGEKRAELQVFGYGAAQYTTCTGKILPGCSDVLPVVENVDWIVRRFMLETSDTPRAERSLPLGAGTPPEIATVDAIVRASPYADAVLKAEWKKLIRDDAEDRSASAAFHKVAMLVLRAASGHGKVALEYLRMHTDWGCGLVDDSADASKYASDSWLAAELKRVEAKHPTTVIGGAEAFDDGFDCAAFVPPPNLPSMRDDVPDDEALAPSPIVTTPAVTRGRQPPPPRDYLLRHANGQGFVPRGKVGLLNAAGGTGKTTGLVQLAVSLATGRPWFGNFLTPANSGPLRTLLLLGEEDAEEVARKLFWTCEAMQLTEAESAAVDEFVVAVPLAGTANPLLERTDHENLTSTRHAAGILERLSSRNDWGLVVVDPVSRFTAVNIEGDNIVATRYVQELERFVAPEFGKPTCCAVGHTSKLSRREKTADVRGVTGLYDAARWVLTMFGHTPERVELAIRKNNLAPPPPHEGFTLLRGAQGLLTVESAKAQVEREDQEAAEREAATDARAAAEDAAEDARRNKRIAQVVEAAHATPGLTANELATQATGKRVACLEAVRAAVASGLLTVERVGSRVGHFVNPMLRG